MMLKPQVQTVFTLTAIKPDGRRRPLTGECPNIFLNVGKNIIGSVNSWFTAVHVGVSNVAPDPTQDQLQAWRGGSNNVIADEWGAQQNPPYYGWRKKTFQISGISNENLNEVGISNSVGNDPVMISRSLLRNLNGDIVTVTLLPGEILEVQAELRVYPPLTDVTGSIDINGTTYNYIARASDVLNSFWWGQQFGQDVSTYDVAAEHWACYDNDIGPITGLPSGLRYNTSTDTKINEAYQNNSFSRVIGTAVGSSGWNATTGKLARSFLVDTTLGRYQVQFDNTANPGFGIPKEPTQSLQMTYRLAWDQYTP
jgi:hypothetical protein